MGQLRDNLGKKMEQIHECQFLNVRCFIVGVVVFCDDDVETPPPKNSKLEVKCAELDISPGNLPMPPKKMNSAEDVSDSMSCWDAWKEKVNKKHDADKDAFTVDMDNMSCMDAWTHVCQSQWPLLRY